MKVHVHYSIFEGTEVLPCFHSKLFISPCTCSCSNICRSLEGTSGSTTCLYNGARVYTVHAHIVTYGSIILPYLRRYFRKYFHTFYWYYDARLLRVQESCRSTALLQLYTYTTVQFECPRASTFNVVLYHSCTCTVGGAEQAHFFKIFRSGRRIGRTLPSHSAPGCVSCSRFL